VNPTPTPTPTPTDYFLLITDNFFTSQPTTLPATTLHPSNAAYIIYTSGTTGQPKGAVLTHGSFVNFIADYTRAFGLNPDDRMVQFASFSFDAALCESFMALISGAELVFTPEPVRLNPEAFSHFLEDEAITVALLTPTVLSRTRPPAGAALRTVIAAGEACSWDIVRTWGQGRDFFNGYGPTEATIGCSYHRVRMEDTAMARTAPIGKPIANGRLHVVSHYGMLQPVGVPGELLIAGLPVGRGYLHRPDLTAEKFIPDSFSQFDVDDANTADERGSKIKSEKIHENLPHQRRLRSIPIHDSSSRLYRTGDLVRRLPTGALEFLGRVDRQVKHHGIRIELGEIEAALISHPAVTQAVVLLWQQDNTGFWSPAGPLSPGSAGDQWLLAYVVARDATTAEDLRGHLARRLPAYMLPARIHLLEQLPMTLTGKVDFRALPSPDQPVASDQHQPPATPLEQSIAEVWQELLRLPEVARHDDFFALGGHSLLAARAASRLSQALDREIPLQWLFQQPTPAALAGKITDDWSLITDNSHAAPTSEVIPHDPLRNTAPLSFAQQRLWFLEQLEPGHPSYHIPLAVRLRGPLDADRLESALNRILARHASLRATFHATPDGPIQRVHSAFALTLAPADITHLPPDARLDEAIRLVSEAARQPFDLEQGPLLRTQLLRLDEVDHLFTLTLHHLIADGWSVGVLLRELEALYRNPDARLPDLSIQYPDFAAWQREWLSGERLQALLDFWRDHLADAPPRLDLPTDFPVKYLIIT